MKSSVLSSIHIKKWIFLSLLAAFCTQSALAAGFAPRNASPAGRDRVMAPGMWHKISNGDPITIAAIKEAAYLVLDDNKHGKASFQLALVPGDDVVKSLKSFQTVTGITSGKGQAVFNVEKTELDQWIRPAADGSHNHAANNVEKSREGLMVCLFSGAVKGQPGALPPPHCHTMLAGFDDLNSDATLTGGYPATGGHLGGAIVHVVLEMQVDSYPEVIEKVSGGSELGGLILTVSEKQAQAARQLLSNPAAHQER